MEFTIGDHRHIRTASSNSGASEACQITGHEVVLVTLADIADGSRMETETYDVKLISLLIDLFCSL